MSNIKSRLKRMMGAGQPLDTPPVTSPPSQGFQVVEHWYPATYRHGDTPLLPERASFQALLRESGIPTGGEGCVFMDTETTGLSTGAGTLAFLIGLGWFEGTSFRLMQYFLPEPCSEDAMLEAVVGRLAVADPLVSFNGRSYDIPLLRSRLAMNRRREALDMPHLDLLHPARRMWKLRLTRCPLIRLEQEIMAYHREGDIDGAEIPAMYFAYLRDGDMERLETVFAHNRLDILALAALTNRMGSNLLGLETMTETMDVFSVGRMHQRAGNAVAAETCFRHSEPHSRPSYAKLLKGQCRYREAIAIWRRMAEACEGGIHPLVELAKVYEHRLKDLHQALSWTQRALGRCQESERDELNRREQRLLYKIKRGG